MQCSTGLGKVHPALLSAALHNRLAAALCQCDYNYKHLLFIQVCGDPSPMHCGTGLGKMHSPLLSAALQIRLTAALCHCNCIYEDLLFIQVCSDPALMHCNTGFGKMHSPLVRCCSAEQAHSSLVSLQLHLRRFVVHAVTQHHCTAALVLAKCISHCSGIEQPAGTITSSFS